MQRSNVAFLHNGYYVHVHSFRCVGSFETNHYVLVVISFPSSLAPEVELKRNNLPDIGRVIHDDMLNVSI